MVKPVPNKPGFNSVFHRLLAKRLRLNACLQPCLQACLKPGLRWVMVGGLGGLAMAIATPPYALWPLAWIALIPLWGVVLDSDALPHAGRGEGMRSVPKMATTLAWAWMYNGVTLHWIWGLHPLTWMGVPEGASLAIALLCWLAVTLWGSLLPLLWMGAMGWIQHRIRTPWALIAAGTGLWCAIDGLMSCSPLYWNPLALSQSPGNRLILHLGRLGGPLWITAALVAVNGLLAGLVWGRMRLRRHTRAQREGPGVGHRDWVKAAWAALALLLVVHGMGAVLMDRAASAPTQPGALPSALEGDSLKIGVIQGNVPTRIKLTPTGQVQSVDRYVNGYAALAQAGVDAVLTPEGALPFALEAAIEVTEDFEVAFAQAQQTRPRPPVAWVGAFGFDAGRYTQSLFGLEPPPRLDGEQALTSFDLAAMPRYDKVKLVPLGEYIPLEPIVGAVLERLSPLPQGMRSGSLGQRFQTPWGLAAVEICYEPAFSEVVRRQVAQGAEFILSSSNLDPYSEVLMAQSEAHDVMRAVETDRWIARATNTGYSGFIDPQGQVVWRSPAHETVRHAQSIDLRQSTTPYVRWGGWTSLPLIMLPLLMIGGTAVPLRR